MLIIGCDFHSRFQQISMVDTERGELIERRLDHSNGEAQYFYAELQKPVRVGMEANRVRAMVRTDASRAGIRALDRGCSRDSRGDSPRRGLVRRRKRIL